MNMGNTLTDSQADILMHTARNGRYVTSDPEVLALAADGLLCDHGPQRLADGDHYLTITGAGVAALREWREKQPTPPKSKRRSAEFDKWLAYREIDGRISFKTFLHRVRQKMEDAQ